MHAISYDLTTKYNSEVENNFGFEKGNRRFTVKVIPREVSRFTQSLFGEGKRG